MNAGTERVLRAIKRYQREHQLPPSIRDLQDLTGITSTSVVNYHLDKLEQQGLIRRTPRVARGIVVTEAGA